MKFKLCQNNINPLWWCLKIEFILVWVLLRFLPVFLGSVSLPQSAYNPQCDLPDIVGHCCCFLFHPIILGSTVLTAVVTVLTGRSNLCTVLLSSSLFSSSFSFLLRLRSVVLGDTYNIPLDPRGKQYDRAALHPNTASLTVLYYSVLLPFASLCCGWVSRDHIAAQILHSCPWSWEKLNILTGFKGAEFFWTACRIIVTVTMWTMSLMCFSFLFFRNELLG